LADADMITDAIGQMQTRYRFKIAGFAHLW